MHSLHHRKIDHCPVKQVKKTILGIVRFVEEIQTIEYKIPEGPLTPDLVLRYFDANPETISVSKKEMKHVKRFVLKDLFPILLTMRRIGELTGCNHSCVVNSCNIVLDSDKLTMFSRNIIKKFIRK